MDDSNFVKMREYILATEYLMQPEYINESKEAINEIPLITESVKIHRITEDLKEIMFKLRSFTESIDENMALGIELGMQRAADMIENVIRNHTEESGDQVG